MSISNYGTKLKYDGIDLLRPIDILPNEHGNYKDIEGQFRVQGWELPLIFRIGASLVPIAGEHHRLTVAVDALHPNNNNESINLGAEYCYSITGFGKIYFRGGVRGLYMDDTIFGPTFGGGFHFILMNNRTLKIDYAYKDIGVFGNTMTYSIGFNF